MAEGGGNDFWLKFQTDAPEFSAALETGLEPGIQKINSLKRALAEYEEQADKLKSGSSPLGLTFTGLDEAAARLEKASALFSTKFESQLEALSTKITGLSEILTTAAREIRNSNGNGNGNGGGGGTGGDTPPPGRQETLPPLPGYTAEQSARIRAQQQGSGERVVGEGRNATLVTKAEIDAARKKADATGKSAQSDENLAKVNTAFAKNARALSDAVGELAKKVKTVTKGTDPDGTGTDSRTMSGEVQVGNTPSNPIPVIIVGAEPGSAQTGHAHTHGHTPAATTATQTAQAKEEVAAAADVVSVARGTRREPRRVLNEDSTVQPGEYFTLPGSEDTHRAYGIRSGETASQYVERVQGTRTRAERVLERYQLEPEDADRLAEFKQSGRELPKTKEISQPTDRIANWDAKTQADIDRTRAELQRLREDIEAQREYIGELKAEGVNSKGRQGAYDRLNSLKAEREETFGKLTELTGVDNHVRGLRSGSYIAPPELARATPVDLPPDIADIWQVSEGLRGHRAKRMNQQMLMELVRDPRMTQDGLPPEAKQALKAIDAQLLNPDTEFGRGDYRRDAKTAKSMFKEIGLGHWNITNEEIDALKEGAARRSLLTEQGQGAHQRFSDITSIRKFENAKKELAKDDLKPERRAKLLRKYPELSPEAQREKSESQQSLIRAKTEDPEAVNKRLSEQRQRAQASLQNAEEFHAKLSRLENRGGFFVDPEAPLREDGDPKRISPEQLIREYQAKVQPTISELAAQEKRAEQAAKRYAQDPTRRHLVARNHDREAQARNQREAIAPPKTNEVEDPELEEKRQRRREAFAHLTAVDDKLTGTASRMGNPEYEGAYSEWFDASLAEREHKSRSTGAQGSVLDSLRRRSENYKALRAGELQRITDETLASRVERVEEPEVNAPKQSKKGAAKVEAQQREAMQDLDAQLKAKEDYRKKLSEGSKKAKKVDAEIAELQSKISTTPSGSLEEPAVKVGSRTVRRGKGDEEATAQLTEPGEKDFDQAANNEKYLSRGAERLSEIDKTLAQFRAEMGRIKRMQSPGAVRKRDGAGTVLRERSGFPAGDDELGGAIAALQDEEAALRDQLLDIEAGSKNAPRPPARANGGTANGGGGGRKPPTPPAGGGSSEEPESEGEPESSNESSNARPNGRSSKAKQPKITDYLDDPNAVKLLEGLKQETRNELLGARAALEGRALNDPARQQIIARGAGAFLRDPGIYDTFDDAAHRRGFVASVLRVPQREAFDALKASGGTAVNYNAVHAATAKAAEGEAKLAHLREVLAGVDDKLTTQEARRIQTRFREYQATNTLSSALESGDHDRIGAARVGLMRASMDREQAEQAATEPNQWEQLTGRNPGSQTFMQGMQRHMGNALENTVAYSLVFTGFEKLRELVHTGLEAQAAFVRLQASLDANGRSAEGLRSKMEGISSATATPLEHVIGAASELAGIFKSNDELTFATKISAELANISQGALTATEAAVGLRDVTAAYGLSGTDAIQAVGDQMAHLSQLTGVNVKDIVEGTTQIAQEAHAFGLSQRQAATLTAYSTYATGESGEASAYQLSRMMTSLNHGNTQAAIVKALGTVGEGPQTQKSFDQGKVGDVLTNLMSKWATLTDPQRQNLSSMMGTGITGRIFAALMNAGPHGVIEMGGDPNKDKGSLGRQNAAFLHSLSGVLRQLSEDFQNLGSVLQRIGAFDLIGIVAKSLDKLLNFLDTYIGKFADLVGKIPGGSAVTGVAVPGLEALGLYKLLGGPIRNAFGNAFGPGAGARVNTFMSSGIATPGFLNAPIGKSISTAFRGRELPDGTRAPGLVSRVPGFFAAPFRAAGRLPSRLTGPTLTDEDVRLSSRDLALVGTTGSGPATSASAQERVAQRAEITIETRATRAMADFTIAMENATRALQGLGPITEEAEMEIRALGSASMATAEEQLAAGAVGGAPGGRGGFRGMLRSGGPALGFGLMLAGQMGGDALLKGTHEGDGSGRRFAGNTLKDAGTGAMLGSFLGPEGTFIGAGAGALVGEFTTLAEDPPPKANTDYEIQSMRKAFKKHIEPAKDATVAETEATRKAYDKDMEKREAAYVNSVGHFDKKGAKLTKKALEQDRLMIDTALEDRISVLQGLGDMINADQVQNLNAAAASLGQFDARTLRAQPGAVKAMLANAGAPKNSAALKDLDAATGTRGQNDFVFRNKEMQKFYQDMIKSIQLRMKFVKQGSAEYPKLQQELATAMAGLQQATGTVIDGPIQFATSAASIAAQYGDTHTAIANLRRANQLLLAKAAGLEGNNPEYLAAMQQVLQNQQQMAQLAIKPQIQKLELQQASTSDPAEQAKIGYEIATKNLEADSKALADKIHLDQKAVAEAEAALKEAEAAMVRWIESGDMTGPGYKAVNDAQNNAKKKRDAAIAALGSDKTSKSDQQHTDQVNQQSQKQSSAQSDEAINQSRAQAAMAGVRNTVTLAQMQLAEARRQESVFASGRLKDEAKYNSAVAAEKQASIQIADALEAQTQAAMGARSALATRHGDSVGAARDDLARANQAYAYAVKEYGKNSEQAYTALSQVYQSQQAAISAELEYQNSKIDLHIAQLNARGKLGDDVAASRGGVQKARNALRSYLHHGGKRGTTEYNKLLGDLATAQRSAFDTALQAQLDTLDFQRETYKITSSQEVQSLQQILKNKQLTLKEQRDITLKIKNLQQSIREQLTQGGLNIPSDIKLPTAYDVRRSLGSGFGGSGASVSTVNNNQQVTIHNTVAGPALVQQITNSVISAINAQTGKQLRANSSTPRLVPTR